MFVGRRHGVDVRAVGSGNIGATNVTRSMGWRAGVLTLAGDMAKGALPQLVCEWLGLDAQIAAWAGLASVLGHVFPLFSRFHGGKGVATAFGVLLVLAPTAAIGTLAVFAVAANATRFVSVGSMAAACVMPFALAAFDAPWPVVQAGIGITVANLWRHKENLLRLMDHREPRF